MSTHGIETSLPLVVRIVNSALNAVGLAGED
jgi:hypothetical protein